MKSQHLLILLLIAKGKHNDYPRLMGEPRDTTPLLKAGYISGSHRGGYIITDEGKAKLYKIIDEL